jgi:hypothetical protein
MPYSVVCHICKIFLILHIVERARTPIPDVGASGLTPHKTILGIYLIGSPLF